MSQAGPGIIGEASYDPLFPYGYGLSYHACNYQWSWCTIESVGRE
jgi:hypothetical protein